MLRSLVGRVGLVRLVLVTLLPLGARALAQQPQGPPAAQAAPPMVKENATVKVSEHVDQLGSMNPATIVPSHGPVGDGSLIGEQRDVLKALQARARELREQGRTAEQAAQALVAEFQAKYPAWVGPNRVGAAVRSFFGEM